VDLDGTLVATDTLWETFLQILTRRPMRAITAVFWLVRGRAYLKYRLARSAPVEVADLPYRAAVLDLIRQAKAQGRQTVLATAADQSVAQRIADHLGIFDHVIASDGKTNRKGWRKAEAIAESLGDQKFDYVGDSRADLAVWKYARRCWTVAPTPQLKRANPRLMELGSGPSRPWATAIRAMRVHQWAKNVLLFVPLLLAHEIGDLEKLLVSLAAFLSFSLCASASYIWNDLVDLVSDRQNPEKCDRPLASGTLSINRGIVLSFVLLGVGFGLAAMVLPSLFLLMLVGYLAVTLTYSVYLKRKLMVDVLTLGFLYTFRILAGAVASDVIVSDWLLAFSIFFFLSLAFVKRYTDLAKMPTDSSLRIAGRGYYAVDLDMVRSLGPSAGLISVLIMALYITSPEVAGLYSSPAWLWLICLCLLYWLARVWFLTQRGQMPLDPVVFALRDRISIATGIVILAALTAAAIL